MKFQSSREYLNKLNNLFNGLIAIPLLLVGFGYLEISTGSWVALIEPSNAMVGGMAIGLVLMIAYLGIRFKKEARNIAVFDDLQQKMEAYYSLASFFYWSVFALSLIATALLYLFAHVAFTLVYAFNLFWLSVNRPTLRNLTELFGLEDEEKRKFMNKEPLDE